MFETWQYLWFAGIGFLLGTCFGSFLNVCIYRIPREESVVAPRSHCPHCQRLIPWHLNIPIFSYLALCGKCAYCRQRISPRYVIVELLTGILFLLVCLQWINADTGRSLLHLDPLPDLQLVPVYWLMLFGLVLGTFVDFEHMIIPDRVTLGGIVLGVAISLVVPELHRQSTLWGGLREAALGLALGWGLLWGVSVFGRWVFKKDAMGFGDVKLMGAIGAFLGWKAVLFTLVASSFVGSVVGISLVLSRRKAMQSQIPYGPYIALAAVLWMYWGHGLLSWYVGLLTPTMMTM